MSTLGRNKHPIKIFPHPVRDATTPDAIRDGAVSKAVIASEARRYIGLEHQNQNL
jgi:hypothetical protein